MQKKIQSLEEMMKLLIKQQNPDLNDNDIEHMMSRIFAKENSSTVSQSSTFTHVPCHGQVTIFGLNLNELYLSLIHI